LRKPPRVAPVADDLIRCTEAREDDHQCQERKSAAPNPTKQFVARRARVTYRRTDQ
jgi:hypothetical protein